eukprot:488661-Hanusia_phi.AAC.2
MGGNGRVKLLMTVVASLGAIREGHPMQVATLSIIFTGEWVKLSFERLWEGSAYAENAESAGRSRLRELRHAWGRSEFSTTGVTSF